MLTASNEPAVARRQGAPANLVRVVLVDDDPAILRITQLHLQTAGFDCRAFGSPGEAMAAILADGGDVLLLDWRLAGAGEEIEDGIELYRRLREAGCVMPAILVSGDRNPEVVREALEAGIREVALKSVDDARRLPALIRRLHAESLP